MLVDVHVFQHRSAPKSCKDELLTCKDGLLVRKLTLFNQNRYTCVGREPAALPGIGE